MQSPSLAPPSPQSFPKLPPLQNPANSLTIPSSSLQIKPSPTPHPPKKPTRPRRRPKQSQRPPPPALRSKPIPTSTAPESTIPPVSSPQPHILSLQSSLFDHPHHSRLDESPLLAHPSADKAPIPQRTLNILSNMTPENTNSQIDQPVTSPSIYHALPNMSNNAASITYAEMDFSLGDVAAVEDAPINGHTVVKSAVVPSGPATRRRVRATARRNAKAKAANHVACARGDVARMNSDQDMGVLSFLNQEGGDTAQTSIGEGTLTPDGLQANEKAIGDGLRGSLGKAVPAGTQNIGELQQVEPLNFLNSLQSQGVAPAGKPINTPSVLTPETVQHGNLYAAMQLEEPIHVDARQVSSTDHPNQAVMHNPFDDHAERSEELGALAGSTDDAAANAVAPSFLAYTANSAFNADHVTPFHNHGFFATAGLAPYASHAHTSSFPASSTYDYSPISLSASFVSPLRSNAQFTDPSSAVVQLPLHPSCSAPTDVAGFVSNYGSFMHSPQLQQAVIHGQHLNAGIGGITDLNPQADHLSTPPSNRTSGNSSTLTACDKDAGVGSQITPPESAATSQLLDLTKNGLCQPGEPTTPVRFRSLNSERKTANDRDSPSAVDGNVEQVEQLSSEFGKGEGDLKEMRENKPLNNFSPAFKVPKNSGKVLGGIAKVKRKPRVIQGEKTKRAVASTRKQPTPILGTNPEAMTDAAGSKSRAVLGPSAVGTSLTNGSISSPSLTKSISKRTAAKRKRQVGSLINEGPQRKGLAQKLAAERTPAIQQSGPILEKVLTVSDPLVQRSTMCKESAIPHETRMALQSVLVPSRGGDAESVEPGMATEHLNQQELVLLADCRGKKTVDLDVTNLSTGEKELKSSGLCQKSFARRKRGNFNSRHSWDPANLEQIGSGSKQDGGKTLSPQQVLQLKKRAEVLSQSRSAKCGDEGSGHHFSQHQSVSRDHVQDCSQRQLFFVNPNDRQGAYVTSAPETVEKVLLSPRRGTRLGKSDSQLHLRKYHSADLRNASLGSVPVKESLNPSANLSAPIRSTIDGQLEVSQRKFQTSSAISQKFSVSSDLNISLKPDNPSSPTKPDTLKALSKVSSGQVRKGNSSTKQQNMNVSTKVPGIPPKRTKRPKFSGKKGQKPAFGTFRASQSPPRDGSFLLAAKPRIKRSLREKSSKLSTQKIYKTGSTAKSLSDNAHAALMSAAPKEKSSTLPSSDSNAVALQRKFHDKNCQETCESSQPKISNNRASKLGSDLKEVKPIAAPFPIRIKLRIREASKPSEQRLSSVPHPKVSVDKKSRKTTESKSVERLVSKKAKRKNDISFETSVEGREVLQGDERSEEVFGTRNGDVAGCGAACDNITENSLLHRETYLTAFRKDRKSRKTNAESSAPVPISNDVANNAGMDQGHSRTHPRPKKISANENMTKRVSSAQPSLPSADNFYERTCIPKKRLPSQFVMQRNPKKPRPFPDSVLLSFGQLKCGLCQQGIEIKERAEHPLFPVRSLSICPSCYGTVCNKFEERREQAHEQKTRLFIAVVEEMIRCLCPSERKAAAVEVFHEAVLAEDTQEVLRRAKSHPVPYEMLGIMRTLFSLVGVSFEAGKLVLPNYVLALPSSEDMCNMIIEAIPRSLSDLEAGSTAGGRLWTSVFGDNLTGEAPISACLILERVFGLVDIRTRHIGVCEWDRRCPRATCSIRLKEVDLNQVCSRAANMKSEICQVFSSQVKEGQQRSEGDRTDQELIDDVMFASTDDSCCICTQSHDTMRFPFEFVKCKDCSRRFCSICVTNVLGSMEYIRSASGESYCCLVCRMKRSSLDRMKTKDISKDLNENIGGPRRRGKPRGSARNNALPLLLLSNSIRGRLQGVEVDERDVMFAKLCESLNSQQVSHLQGKKVVPSATDERCLRCRLPVKQRDSEGTGTGARSRRGSVSEQSFLKCTERNCAVVMHKHCHSIRKPTKTRGAFSGMLCPRHKCLVCQGKGEAKLTRCRTCPSTFCREHVPRPCDMHIFSEKLIACSDCKANLHIPQMSMQRPPILSRNPEGQAGSDIAKSLALSQRQKQMAIEGEIAKLEGATGRWMRETS